MLNQYPAWKNTLVALVVVFGLFFALPNVYGEDPAVQVTHSSLRDAGPALVSQVENALRTAGIPSKAVELREGRALARFQNADDQLKAADVLKRALENDYVVALNLAPRTPEWLRRLGLGPMNLGLDLRGGVHFLLEVDMESAIEQQLERYVSEVRTLLRDKNIRYAAVTPSDNRIDIRFRDAAQMEQARDELNTRFSEFVVDEAAGADGQPMLVVRLAEARVREVRNFAVEQNITTLRNRVNELGVAEPIIQRQGEGRIVVQLPGIQDTARAKEILGATATLEFRLVDTVNDPGEAQRTGRVPLTSKLYTDDTPNGLPVLLRRDIIVTGDQLVDAAAGFDQQTGSPAVFVTLDAMGARRMSEVTAANIEKPMAVVFIENKIETQYRNGEEIKQRRTVERIISIATIRDVLSNRFQITGLEPEEARNLALLLRAGALAAPVDIIEERTIGPSLGKDNIEQGTRAVLVGFLLVVVFMALYYRVFGLVANCALLMNVVLIVGAMSLLQATLTMPGIAGIVLTVGMAVDANVLIYERIREELRKGNTPQAAIHSGYEQAFSTIADANVTTLIAALVLFMFGTGPVKGFAVVLSIGILTSMFTAIMGTRSLVNLIYGGRKVARLSI